MILTYFLLLFSVIVNIQANCWHGIVPLRSMRADVEKALGSPTPDSKALYAAEYRTKNERVFVLYSTGPCNIDPSHGWNITRNIVIEISVEPDSKPKFSDLKIDLTKFEKRRDQEVLHFTYYTNEEEGISIEVNTDEGVVKAFRYFPTSKDRYLRCPASFTRQS